jgi:peptidoglycan biosynthesis protein MviN/MurJ (putative lipid II flippase)
MMRRYAGRLETGALIKTLAKLAVAGVFLAGVCWMANHLFFNEGLRMSEWKKIGEVAITVGVGTLVFFGAASALRIAEVNDVVDLVRRRLRR